MKMQKIILMNINAAIDFFFIRLIDVCLVDVKFEFDREILGF